MNSAFVTGALLGMIGALLMNVGKGVQKHKVHVLRKGRRIVAPRHRRDLCIWLVGIGMTVSSTVPYGAGIWLSGSPSTIAAMTGVGLCGVVIYAWWVLGERIGVADGMGIGLVVIGTSVLSYIGATQEGVQRTFAPITLLTMVAALTGTAAIACLVALRVRRLHGAAYGLTAGMLIGLAMFLVDAGAVVANGSLAGLLRTPFPWLALLALASALTVTQLGFFRSRALVVIPSLNSSTILVPVLLEATVYGQLPGMGSATLIAVIVVGVLLLSSGASASAAGSPIGVTLPGGEVARESRPPRGRSGSHDGQLLPPRQRAAARHRPGAT